MRGLRRVTRGQGERPAAVAVPWRPAQASGRRAVVRLCATRPGGSLGSQSERGHWFVVAFLYTHCPDVCPLIANNLGTAMRKLPDLRVLAISVDPKRDTPAAVRTFLRVHRLPAKFRYLTGTRARTRAGLEEVPRRRHSRAPTGRSPTTPSSYWSIRVGGSGSSTTRRCARPISSTTCRCSSEQEVSDTGGSDTFVAYAAGGGCRGVRLERLDSAAFASWSCSVVGGLWVSGRAPSGRRPSSTISDVAAPGARRGLLQPQAGLADRARPGSRCPRRRRRRGSLRPSGPGGAATRPPRSPRRRAPASAAGRRGRCRSPRRSSGPR